LASTTHSWLVKQSIDCFINVFCLEISQLWSPGTKERHGLSEKVIGAQK
jgi:hypothetical protein